VILSVLVYTGIVLLCFTGEFTVYPKEDKEGK